MSDFKFHCLSCRQRFRCDTGLTGRRIVCPRCQRPIVIPPAEEVPMRQARKLASHPPPPFDG